MNLSALLSSLRSSPSLEALRQIPQPILIEWAREEMHVVSCGPVTIVPSEIWATVAFVSLPPTRGVFIFRHNLIPSLLRHIESRASLLSILRARQQQIQQQAPLAAWQAESEARLIEDVG